MLETLTYFIKLDKEGILYEVDVETTTSIRKVLDRIYNDQDIFFRRLGVARGELELYAVSRHRSLSTLLCSRHPAIRPKEETRN